MKRNSRMIRTAIIACLSGIFTLSSVYAQQGFTYQAVARNQDNTPMANQQLSVRIAINADSHDGDLIWQEEQDVQTSSLGLFTLNVGDPDAENQGGEADLFDQIDWSAHNYYLNVWVKTDGDFIYMGDSPIRSVPIAQHAASASSAKSSFSIQPVEGTLPGEALFEVKAPDGRPVFAVYEDMVWVYVDTTEKKGVRGGFAVGGYSRNKGVTQEYMRVTPDSVRVYIDTDPGSKSVKGGFAVGGYSRNTKGTAGDLIFNLSPKTDADVIIDKSQILFYPAKDAFFAGTIHIGSADSVGQNSTSLGYKTVAMGRYSQAFGYKSMALGDDSYAFGSGAVASGDKSFAFGSVGIDTAGAITGVPTSATGDYSIAFGMGAQAANSGAMSLGANSTSSGWQSVAIGTGTYARGSYSTAIGYKSSALDPYSTALGYRTHAEGQKSIAIGAHYNATLYVYNYKTRTWELQKITSENRAVGDYSISFGNGNLSENGGIALGTYNKARDQGAVALGTSNNAQSAYTLAAGYNNQAVGYYSMAIGENLYAQSMNSLAIGTYNDTTGSIDEWVETDPLFQIGNGTRGSSRHDAFRVDKNGKARFLPVNSTYGVQIYSSYGSDFTQTSGYGLRVTVSRGKEGVDYYSGYFAAEKGILGTYHGLHADKREGDGFDVAEYYYDTSGDTEPGDVLVADPEKEESVIKSSGPYQTSVLGVVSTDPHLVMGMDLIMNEVTGEPIPGVSAARLALTGRVPVKITEENGPIEPGDLLTTSSTPGHAMKWTLLDVSAAKDFEELKGMLAENENRRNAIIGKAVGSSGSGSGTVMVLISLQ
jgi:hypothetical protein